MNLQGRKAVVTGGTRGIGAAVAQGFLEAGAAVLVSARDSHELLAVVEKWRSQGFEAYGLACDVAAEDAGQKHVEAVADTLETVDILVCNAGIAFAATLERTEREDWDRVLAVNVTGAFELMRAFVPGMKARKWGRVVNVASIAALHGGRYISAYSASKHALLGLTKSVAAEVADCNVRVDAVCPGFVDTSMTDETINRIMSTTGRSREEAVEAALESAGQSRLVTPDEVAEAVLSLVSKPDGLPPGPILVLDGGDRPKEVLWS